MAPNRMFQQLTDKTKQKKHRPFYEAVNAHVRRRLINSDTPAKSINTTLGIVTSSAYHWPKPRNTRVVFGIMVHVPSTACLQA